MLHCLAGWPGSPSNWDSCDREAADPGAQPSRHQEACAGKFPSETVKYLDMQFIKNSERHLTLTNESVLS